MLRKFELVLMLLVCWGFHGALATHAQEERSREESAARLKLPEGFQGELLYTVPDEQGSWVALTHDPRGRLIASDQYGKLYRITPAKEGKPRVETIDLEIGFAQGLLCAFDSLYVVSYGMGTADKPSGLYRVRDTDGDDQYDHVELLRKIEGSSEHGPHAVVLGPDKKSLYICAGNHTKIPEPETSRVPRNWQEDLVLPRFPDANGHAAGILAPGGWICKTDPEGKAFELVAIGFRNAYDIAFAPNGELFTYDADMEWDFGLPWYRPTRICHVVSGSEFGWRHGSGKWPEYYPDSVPPVLNIGPGSPTGVTFGTGARFPVRYQNALFAADWSYGIIYAITLKPHGATYTAEREMFCSAPALPVTDLVINPIDGAMYFLIGGRRTHSALYRITYTGTESTRPATFPILDPVAIQRRQLERYHTTNAGSRLDEIWEQLASSDRLIRYAARIAIEHEPVSSWSERATQEKETQRALEAIMALARCGDASHQSTAITALDRLDWNDLTEQQRIHLLRNYGLVLCRLGEPTEQTKQTIAELTQFLPTGVDSVDRELAQVLVAAEATEATAKVLDLLLASDSAQSQIAYAKMLGAATHGWTLPMREKYFEWFLEMAKSRGGNSFGGYVENIKKRAVENLAAGEKAALAEILNRKPATSDPYADLKARPFVKKWSLSDLLPSDDSVFADRDLANGKKMFALATCYKCHRISMEGGMVGPDLTTAGHRFATKDLLEAIVDPSKAISDQYQATLFQMDDGRVVVGRVANLHGEDYMVQENVMEPNTFTNIKFDEIEDMQPSDISLMPTGLLDNLTKDEILDLLAYLKSTAKQPTGGTGQSPSSSNPRSQAPTFQ